MSPEIIKLSQIIWKYHLLNQNLKKCDAILVLGSNDTRVAEYAAQLFLKKWAPKIVFSGGVGKLTEGMFGCSEAKFFSKIALERGVPKDKIYLEELSTNTGENIEFTKKLITKQGLNIKNILLVQKPFMERRSFATFKKKWPEINLCVSSPQIKFSNYANEILTMEDIINVMVGDLQRIKEYPAKGFQIHQDIPPSVLQAFEKLVSMGFNKHLI